jgi:hypothetical protein
VIGDEFTGESIQPRSMRSTRLNPPDGKRPRRVRIHAIGFPEGAACRRLQTSALLP